MRLYAFLLPGLVLLGPLAACAESVQLPDGKELREVDFERHVAALLGKLGCNAGSCHGSFQGKGGLRLSLFGHDPEKDFTALTRDALGRRLDSHAPDRSLVLLKATGQAAHGGGKRLDRDSWPYHILRSWIEQGCRHQAASGAVSALQVLPREHAFGGPGERVALKVLVTFADGTKANLAPFCEFRVKDDSVAEVSPLGEVRGLQPGDTPVVVSYRGHLAMARIFIPFPSRVGAPYSETPENSFVDHEVFGKLRRLNILPSELAADTEFLRRVTLDTVGGIPAPEQIRRFVNDPHADKRRRKIEELLAHPLHAALWATKFCDITACNIDVMDGPPELRARRAKMWHDWFRRRLATNVSYKEIVHGVLCASSREGRDVESWIRQEVTLDQAAHQGFDSTYAERPTLDLFWRRMSGDEFFPLEQMAELTATAFLGLRIECAQCHKHPFDRWTQTDYRAYANVFGRVQFGSSPDVTAAVADLLARRRELPPDQKGPVIPRLREVYVSDHRPRLLPHPETEKLLLPRAPGGPLLDLEGDPREALFRWMIRPENPFFARSFVNRVWAHYFGTGLVDPVDSFSVANPPSNERLLDALAGDFVEHGYDLRRLEQLLLTSRTYQLSSRPNASNVRDRTNYSHALARPLLAEVVVDVLNTALGTTEDLGPDAPPGSQAVEVAPNRVRAAHLARIFRVFGRPTRNSTCDCERPTVSALPQTLFLMADPVVLQKITRARLERLLSANRPNADLVEELFLATLSRFPDAQERQAALSHVEGAADRKAAFVDMLWALINTREFILNH
jgi:hypothetical protein